MRQIQVDLLDAEALKACLKLPRDPLRPQAAVVPVLHRVERLGRELRLHPARADPAADRLLTAPAAVSVGGVEVRDAELPGGVHELECLVLREPATEELRS